MEELKRSDENVQQNIKQTEKDIDSVLQKLTDHRNLIVENVESCALLPSALNEEVSPGSQTERLKREMQQLAFYNPGPSTKDLLGFKPEFSNREKRKLNRLLEDKNAERKLLLAARPSLYDEKGLLKDTNEDLCDCLIHDCPGCHFPCSRCDSEKCGVSCRTKRRWKYIYVSYEMTQPEESSRNAISGHLWVDLVKGQGMK